MRDKKTVTKDKTKAKSSLKKLLGIDNDEVQEPLWTGQTTRVCCLPFQKSTIIKIIKKNGLPKTIVTPIPNSEMHKVFRKYDVNSERDNFDG